MDLGQRLKQLRNEKFLTQTQLAKISGVSRKTILNYENNKTKAKYSNIEKLAKALGMETDEFLAPISSKKEYMDIWKSAINDKIDRQYSSPQAYTINIYGNVPAGYPIEAIENIKGTIFVTPDSFPLNKKYIALEVEGNSMYPRFLEGDTVIVELTHEFNNNDIVVAYVNGYKSTLKQIIKNNDGSITLKPYNPEYPEHTYGYDHEQIPISILGVVRELRRTI